MDWFEQNKTSFSGQILFNEPLSRHTYYRIGGPARIFAIPKDQSDIRWLIRGIQETGISFCVIGLGSNILVSDEGFNGLVIRTSRYNLEISRTDHLVRTGASVPISTFLRKASLEGWAGLEFLTGIPGSIGGAVRMNAGTHLGETEGRLQKVEAYQFDSPDPVVYQKSQFQFAYRKNLFLPPQSLVWAAEWKIELGSPSEVKARIDDILARRKQTQPIDLPSCGSVFKNPRSSGLHAWQVIEKIGLRGYQVGQAQFSEKHCNFIVNLGNAKARDVRALIELAKSKAEDQLGIVLEEEVIFLE